MIYYTIVEGSTLTVTTQRRMHPWSTAHQTGMQMTTPQRRYTTHMIYEAVVEASTLTRKTQRRMNSRSTAHQAGMQMATPQEIYHTHDLLHCSGGKYTNCYNTKEDATMIYCTPRRHTNGNRTGDIPHA
jgi:hypothetical protein